MELFKYSATLESLKESGSLVNNCMVINWKLIKSELIVSHSMNNLDIPLYDMLESVKNEVLSYCGNPDGLKELIENVQ